MPYDRYPAVDENFLFPPEVREANGLAPEFRNQVVPLTQTQRNNLTGDDLWNGRLILNTTTNRIDRYDLSSSTWIPMTSEPAGIIKEYGGATAPDYHVLADGSIYPRTGIYAALFAVYGTQYNTGGETSSQFRVPNRKGKVAVGLDASQTEFNVLGKVGGAKTHTLSGAEVPAHDHSGATGGRSAQHTHAGSADAAGVHNHQLSTDHSPTGADYASASGKDPERYVGTGRLTGDAGNHGHSVSVGGESEEHTHTIAASGGGGAHNNLQPYMAMNFIITL